MHVIDDEQQLGAYFDGTGRQEAVRREREAQRAASEQQAAAAAAAEAAASNEMLTVQAIMQSTDKLSKPQIDKLKTVTFNQRTGKKEGGEYFKAFTIRKYFRTPPVMKNMLIETKDELVRLDEERRQVHKASNREKYHRMTMTKEVVAAMERLAENAPRIASRCP